VSFNELCNFTPLNLAQAMHDTHMVVQTYGAFIHLHSSPSITHLLYLALHKEDALDVVIRVRWNINLVL